MDGRLKAALTTYLIREGVKPSRLGDITAVEAEPYHYRFESDPDCDLELEIQIYYDEWTQDMTHSSLSYHTVESEDLEEFLTHIANYGQEGK